MLITLTERAVHRLRGGLRKCKQKVALEPERRKRETLSSGSRLVGVTGLKEMYDIMQDKSCTIVRQAVVCHIKKVVSRMYSPFS